MSMKNNTIVDLSAVFVAILALAMSIWQGIETRQHNKLSVTPKLAIWIAQHDSTKLLTIDFESTGIGPAHIKSIQVIKE